MDASEKIDMTMVFYGNKGFKFWFTAGMKSIEHCSRCLYKQRIVSRAISTSQIQLGKLPKGTVAKQRGLNIGYGPMVDTPDWSYADGRPAPPGFRATTRREIQKQICRRIIELNSDIHKATKKVSDRKRLRIKHIGAYHQNRLKPKIET